MTAADDDRLVSARARAVDASGIRKVFDLAAKLADPINLSIGLPDFDVPEPAKHAAVEAIAAGENRYTPTQGIAPLRERLRADLTRAYGRDVGDVVVTSGVSGGLMLAFMSVLDAGDEAAYLDPYFVMYRHLLTLIGAKGVAVSSYPDFRFDAAKVEAAITPRTKLLVLNSPSNPTGHVMTPGEVRAAVDVARRHDLLILSDEIYEPFRYAAAAGDAYSPLALYEKTVVLRGFSKSHAMTGWRLGYAFGYEPVVAQLAKLQQYTFVCAPAPFQHAALAALDLDMSGHVAAYRAKRDLAFELLSKRFEVVKPEGAFYVFPKVPAGISGTEFCTRAIGREVLVIPGSVFSAADTHFRVSYATTDAKLRRGCEILCELA